MSDTIWSHLCQQPTLIASAEKYKQLVYDSTAELVQPIQRILSALDRRALALSKCATYDAALRDANLMQQLSPTSAIGYLREASIYSEQGKQRHVIDICNQALRIVDPKDVHYATLQQTKVDAEQRQNKHIDFITQLPVDIVHTTLIPMFMKENALDAVKRCDYLYVSNQWRDQIVQCWGGFEFRVHHEDSVISEHCQQLFDFSQYATSLYIHWYSIGTWLPDLFRDHNFCSLRKINIQCLEESTINHFISALKLVRDTVTHLYIDVEDESEISLADIFLACPNLISLDLTYPARIELTGIPTMTKLETLLISYAREEITSDQVIEVFQRFPSLKKLELGPCSDIESALVVSDYCPSMKHLGIVMLDQGVEISFSDQGGACDVQGITHLSIRHSESKATRQHINSIFNKYQRTLQQITWDIEPDSEDNIYNIQYPQLKKLYLDNSGWWIPHNAPMLEELSITSKTIDANPTVLDITPPNLKKLELHLDNGYFADKKALAEYIGSFSHQSQLQQLDIYFNSHDRVGKVLDAICHLHQLQRLMISFTNAWDAYGLERFIDKLAQKSSQISCLEIRCVNPLSTYSMNALKRLENLKQLAFSIDCTDGNDSIWDSIQTFPQLEWIRVYPSYAADKNQIKRLLQHKPDMKISISRHFERF
ncbi:hypothetical protein LRAMOSA11120 [Lichtheimia ramosa]|uniref:F-box domain-containing protein n=1 Tax=Lichtheimia ramosa TaxID=688394 RepID=A0A077WTL8_9FUNG|nr:hypothetical protein LRAMOSA11120 [Lichtheimia ramosa]